MIALNNGESLRSGTKYDLTTSHDFDQTKKITKIVTTIHLSEYVISQIKFFSGEELLCTWGASDDYIKTDGGRVVTFEIADDEQLIGAKLYSETDCFIGLKWLKMKIAN